MTTDPTNILVISGFAFAALLTMSLILVGPGLDTIGTRMFELQEYEGPTSASVLATVVLGFIVLSNLCIRGLSRGRYGI